MEENENAGEEGLGTGSKYKEEVEDLGKGVNRVGRGRRVGEYEEMSWAGTVA
jgi:hypothetical protein